jgi:acyl-CoA thioesterase FadM
VTPVAERGEASWAFSHCDRVRFSDLDAMRHLNNVALVSFPLFR